MTSPRENTLLRQVGALFRLSAQVAAEFGAEKGGAPAHRLQRQRQFFETVLHTSPFAIVLVGMDRRVATCNAAFESLFGFAAEELRGRDVDELIAPAGVLTEALNYTRQAMEGLVHTTTQRHRKDGTVMDVELFGVPVTLGGEQIGSVGIYEDVTEKRRTEAWLRLANTALESAADAIVICDREGKIKWTNPAFARLTGYTATEAHNQTLNILKSGHHPPEFFKQLWETILAGRVWYGQTVNKRKDGSVYVEEQTIAPVRDEQGQLTHYISIKQDVTERNQAMDDLHKAKAEAEAAVQARNDLLAQIHHEFDAPLARLLSFSERLEGELRGLDAAHGLLPEVAELRATSQKLQALVKQIPAAVDRA